MKPKIGIVNSSSFGRVFPEHLEEIESFAEVTRISVPADVSPDDLRNEVQGLHGIVASVSPHYPSELLSSLPDLIVIARHGIGFNNIDVKASNELGIATTKVAGPVERNAVAEQSIALMMSACRHIVQGNEAVRAGRWADRASFIGVELFGKTVGLIGIGNIGGRVAEILSRGFGANVIAHDPNVSSEEIESYGAKSVGLEELLETSDVISLQSALTDSNYHIINQENLEKCKDGLILVNTARGELVNSQAICDALSSGRLRAYAGDVVEGEPIDASHTLLKQPNAIIVPHLGGYTYESLRGMGETMVRTMRQVFVERVRPTDLIDDSIKDIRPWA